MNNMDTVNWKVEGMTCSNCAVTIGKYLEKQGMSNVKVNLVGGEVIFDLKEKEKEKKLQEGIESLGYKVSNESEPSQMEDKRPINKFLRYVLICAPFTLILMLHMIPALAHTWLLEPWIQFALALPVYIVGMSFFGKSAFNSIRNGLPNMNVLIAIGATAAFFYSLAGTLMGRGHEFLFYETSATIITLVFFGNYLEDASVESTQRALNKLAKSQKVIAHMIAFDDKGQELIFPVDNSQLKNGDLILIKSGEQVPADAKILWGEATMNEALITGESSPVIKKQKEIVIGGSLVVDGTLKAQVTAEAKDSVLSNIINLVKQAQSEKPPVQQLADKISAVFVPVVLGIAVVTFIANYFILADRPGALTDALMRSIAVLVIACPCAMGLATPAAIAVGLGRASKNGILFRNAKSLESFKDIKQVVFDKTGTLTSGAFKISNYHFQDISEEEFKRIVFSLEKYSNHPIAKSISAAWKLKDDIRWEKIEEVKGLGIIASDREGNQYKAGSYEIAKAFTKDESFSVYVTKNDKLIGWIAIEDEIRPEAFAVVEYLKNKNIKTILLSGDRYQKCKKLADQLRIEIVIAEQTPQQKLAKIEELNKEAPVAMVGDGINDAPALAKATIGISMSEASQLAMQTADVVLMNNGLKNLPLALGLGKHSFITIKQNLFWAFFYNIIALPVAAFGFLSPTFGALVMGLSDVVLAINSGRLFVKKVV